jgi:hypothetical protein
MTEDPLARLRGICLALPEVSERLNHGSPSWVVGGKKTIAHFRANHHGDGIVGLWCPAPPGVQESLVDAEPRRFYRPPYVGPSGWLGMRLDIDADWDEVAAVIADAYRLVAPKRLVAELDRDQK